MVKRPFSVSRIHTDRAPAPFGHYAQATRWNGLVFISGQLPARPDGSHIADAPFETQARQGLRNLLAMAEAAGSRSGQILKVTAYIVGAEHWPAFNAIYGEAFGASRPARSVVPVPALHHGYLIELDAIAITESQAA